ncbi:MAG: Type 1 glutamine amidotransferase-like domain-containing protein, partial [Phycisphaerae bacterium]|nr:Type 1 glutamine amidotransferase-like domain-containing protein [Phycisphaerae bacterium]
HRLETMLADDPELMRHLHRRQDRLQRRRDLYHIRLAHALDAARELLRLPGTHRDLEAAREDAIRTVHAIDDHHVERVQDLDRAFKEDFDVGARPALAYHRQELAEMLGACDAIAVAGGHVGRLLEQLRLFDLGAALGARPVIAWSAGAMALGRRVVLFHDAPPQGPGDAEVHDVGLARYDGFLPLPHARHRLRLDDPVRVGLFARRFAEVRCVAMDEGARLLVTEDGLQHATGCRWLQPDGTVVDTPATSGAPA